MRGKPTPSSIVYEDREMICTFDGRGPPDPYQRHPGEPDGSGTQIGYRKVVLSQVSKARPGAPSVAAPANEEEADDTSDRDSCTPRGCSSRNEVKSGTSYRCLAFCGDGGGSVWTI